MRVVAAAPLSVFVAVAVAGGCRSCPELRVASGTVLLPDGVGNFHVFRVGAVHSDEHAPSMDLPTGALAGPPLDCSLDLGAPPVGVVAYAGGVVWTYLDGSTPGHWMPSTLRPSRVAVHGDRVAITSGETVAVFDEKGHPEWRGVPGIDRLYFAWPGEPGHVHVLGCRAGSLFADPEPLAIELDYSAGDARVVGESRLRQVTAIEAVASAGGVGFVAGSLERVRSGVSRADFAPAEVEFVLLRIDRHQEVAELVRTHEDFRAHVTSIMPSSACIAVVFDERVVRVYGPVSANAYGLRFEKTFDRAVAVSWQSDLVFVVRAGEEVLQRFDLR